MWHKIIKLTLAVLGKRGLYTVKKIREKYATDGTNISDMVKFRHWKL